MSVNRRELLVGSGAAALCLALPAWAQQAGSADARLHALLMAQFEAQLARDPTQATSLGIDSGERSALRSRFPDWSPAGRDAARRATRSDLAALRALGRAGLSETGQLNYDAAEFQLALEDRLAHDFPYHTSGFGHRAGPYAVTQLGGFYTAVPNFMDTQHPINDRADADAYMARLDEVAGLIDADTDIVRSNAGRGVIAPRFILERAIAQLTSLREGSGRDKTLVRSIERRASEKGLGGYGDRALAVWEGRIVPALTRQIDTLTGLLARSTQDAGVRRLPDGEAYYATTLKLHTTTDLSAEEIHRTGLDQVADLKGRIDTLL